jgi:hypothetical protein
VVAVGFLVANYAGKVAAGEIPTQLDPEAFRPGAMAACMIDEPDLWRLNLPSSGRGPEADARQSLRLHAIKRSVTTYN